MSTFLSVLAGVVTLVSAFLAYLRARNLSRGELDKARAEAAEGALDAINKAMAARNAVRERDSTPDRLRDNIKDDPFRRD